MTEPRPAPELRRRPFATLIRDIEPITPCGYAPKTVVGDAVTISARLVRDGHGLLGARLRMRRADVDGRRWTPTPMEVAGDGAARCEVRLDDPGRYEFEIQAWADRYATWRHDLVARAQAGDDLAVEFLVGAELLEAMAGSVSAAHRSRVRDAARQLRDDGCSDRVRYDAALELDLLEALVGVPDPTDTTTSPRHPLRVDRELAVHGAWYEFFPRSEGGFVPGAGSWDRLEAAAAAGFDVVYLPPIHPVGRAFRKGRDNTLDAGADDVGSPWAIGSAEGGHTAVHPGLGTLGDVEAFIARAGELGVEIALDYALQCSPDHPWVSEHPEWFAHRPDGTIRYAENPPKKYQDIYPIEFWPALESDRVALWQACREILDVWIARGIRVFRVDNPHTKPLAFWAWLIREVQDDHPEVVFLSEAFTDPTMMHSLAEVGFSQSYTYFTWRTTKWELTDFALELAHGPAARWFRPNLWPNTPDILAPPLPGASPAVFAARAVLAATLAPSWGVYSGFELGENVPVPGKEEYRNSEKYELKARDHDRTDSLWPLFTQLNSIRRRHRALARMDGLTFHHADNEDIIAYSHRSNRAGEHDAVLVVVNLAADDVREASVYPDLDALGLGGARSIAVRDELTGESWRWGSGGNYVRLDAERVAHVFAVTRG